MLLILFTLVSSRCCTVFCGYVNTKTFDLCVNGSRSSACGSADKTKALKGREAIKDAYEKARPQQRICKGIRHKIPWGILNGEQSFLQALHLLPRSVTQAALSFQASLHLIRATPSLI